MSVSAERKQEIINDNARKSGDNARIAGAQANFDKVQAAAAQRRAANPDI